MGHFILKLEVPYLKFSCSRPNLFYPNFSYQNIAQHLDSSLQKAILKKVSLCG